MATDKSLRGAVFSDTGHRRTFALAVHIQPGADADAVHAFAGDLILDWVASCISRGTQTITGTSGMSMKRLGTVDARARKGANARIPVFEYEGTTRVSDPHAAEYDREAFRLLRELFLLLAERLGATGGSITLGMREWVAETVDGRLSLEETPADQRPASPRLPSPTL